MQDQSLDKSDRFIAGVECRYITLSALLVFYVA